MAHLFADGGLADIQRCLSRGKSAAFDDAGKHPEQFQINIVQLNHSKSPEAYYIAKSDMNIGYFGFFLCIHAAIVTPPALR
jgi:hypothetical protein